MRGAIPSPRHKLAAAAPHRIRGETPPEFLWLPSQLSMWLNDVDGVCVTAEEAFAKACSSPEIFITDATVKAWATKNNVLNGAELDEVLTWMQTAGFQQDGQLYNDGPHSSVDWTNPAVLTNAITQGPVKIGVAATQLERAVGNGGNGWFGTGFVKDQNLDHCVSLCGFGPMSYLAQRLGVAVPHGIDGSTPGYGLFTWDSVGVIDVPSMVAITGEAWLRNPTTVVVGPKPSPTPTPTPVPVPVPTPPTPAPSGKMLFDDVMAWMLLAYAHSPADERIVKNVKAVGDAHQAGKMAGQPLDMPLLDEGTGGKRKR